MRHHQRTGTTIRLIWHAIRIIIRLLNHDPSPPDIHINVETNIQVEVNVQIEQPP